MIKRCFNDISNYWLINRHGVIRILTWTMRRVLFFDFQKSNTRWSYYIALSSPIEITRLIIGTKYSDEYVKTSENSNRRVFIRLWLWIKNITKLDGFNLLVNWETSPFIMQSLKAQIKPDILTSYMCLRFGSQYRNSRITTSKK